MSKYKVGDKVKVREDLVGGKIYEGQSAVSDMVEFKGKEVTIERTSCSGNDEYRIKELGYTWTNEMFEGLVVKEVKPSFKIGDKVELISIDLYDEMYRLKVGDIGTITCLEADTYCRIDFSPTNMNNCIYYKQIKLVEEAFIEEPNPISKAHFIPKTKETQSIPNKGTIKYRITDDGITYATLNGSKTGKSVKSNKDESRNEVGILISVARSLGFDENKISGIVDVLFDDDSYNSKAKCDNAIIKNDIARALGILDKYKN